MFPEGNRSLKLFYRYFKSWFNPSQKRRFSPEESSAQFTSMDAFALVSHRHFEGSIGRDFVQCDHHLDYQRSS